MGKAPTSQGALQEYWRHHKQYLYDHPAADEACHLPIGLSGDDAKYTLSGSKVIVCMMNFILDKVE